MKRQWIDVELEVPWTEIEQAGGTRVATALILGKLRHTAQDMAEQAKGELVSTLLPEIVIKRTSSILLGGDLYLVASRWPVDVPDSFHPAATR